MTPRVFILATVRKPELLAATTLVFETLRVGFPTAELHVHFNESQTCPFGGAFSAVNRAALSCGAAPVSRRMNHHEWIESLIDLEDEPFWICDTDVIFFDKVEHWGPMFKAPLAGRYIPGFNCEFTKAWTMPRLHTSLMYIDPVKVRAEIEEYNATIPNTYFTPRPNLIYPQFCPEKIPAGMGLWKTENIFYDTCAMLSNAVFTQPFGEDQLDAFAHLNCGTIADIVGPHITDGKMIERHRQIFANPELARGQWQRDNEYYDSRASRDDACACTA